MLKEILDIVSRETRIPDWQILLPDGIPGSRKREIVEARMLCMYFAAIETRKTLYEIGDFYGERDHATVIHAKKTVTNLRDTSREFREKFMSIQSTLDKFNEPIIPNTLYNNSINLGNKRTI